MIGYPLITGVADLLALAACAASTRFAFRELFITVPGIHVARWPGPWLMPKGASLVVLTTAIIGFAASLLLIVVLRDEGVRGVARTIQIIALMVMACAWLAWIADFFAHAGRFG